MTPKELQRLKKDYKRLHVACMKIMEVYAKAPGWANPEPSNYVEAEVHAMIQVDPVVIIFALSASLITGFVVGFFVRSTRYKGWES